MSGDTSIGHGRGNAQRFEAYDAKLRLGKPRDEKFAGLVTFGYRYRLMVLWGG